MVTCTLTESSPQRLVPNKLCVSVVVVSFNTRDLLGPCLESVFEQKGIAELEVIVVDNASEDGSAELVRTQYPQVHLLEEGVNLGFAAAVNKGYAQAKGAIIFLVNSDAKIEQSAFEKMIAFLNENPKVGIVGGLVLYPDGKRASCARTFPSITDKLILLSGLMDKYPQHPTFGRVDFHNFTFDHPQPVDWVPGCLMAIRRTLINQIGFFDPRYFMYFEETDFCLKAKEAGWTTYILPSATAIHKHGGSTAYQRARGEAVVGNQVLRYQHRAEHLYFRKNYGLLAMLANCGAEVGWISLVYLRNLLSTEPRRKEKRRNMGRIIRSNLRALWDTSLGTFSPKGPW